MPRPQDLPAGASFPLRNSKTSIIIITNNLSTMSLPAVRNGCRPRTFASASSHFGSEGFTVPLYLVPALRQVTSSNRGFSTSPSCKSKVGGAPLSVPPEVSFRLSTPPPLKQRARTSRTEPTSIVEVEGPKGKMSMSIPAYMTLQSNEAARSHTLSILDQEDRKQREMWGECRIQLHTDTFVRSVTNPDRDCSCISTKSHPGSQ